jgi:hypothetical protein
MKKLTLICSLVACSLVGAGLEAMYPKFDKNKKVAKINYVPTTPEKQLSENPEYTKNELKKKQSEEKEKQKQEKLEKDMKWVKTKVFSQEPLKEFYKKQIDELLQESLVAYVAENGTSSGSMIDFVGDFCACTMKVLNKWIEDIEKDADLNKVDKVVHTSKLVKTQNALKVAADKAFNLI